MCVQAHSLALVCRCSDRLVGTRCMDMDDLAVGTIDADHQDGAAGEEVMVVQHTLDNVTGGESDVGEHRHIGHRYVLCVCLSDGRVRRVHDDDLDIDHSATTVLHLGVAA